MRTASRRKSFSIYAALAAAAALGSQPASALEYNFGDVQVFFDTTVSAGASMRVADRNMMFVASGNGGPVANPTILRLAGPDGTVATALGGATQNQTMAPDKTINPAFTANSYNYAGSISSDDSRMNFDAGDLTSGTVKMTNDIQANWSNYTFFARVSSFYDAVLDDNSSYARSGIQDGARVDAARDIDLLDFYVSGDYNVGGLPLNVRVGKQVVNWGEATFILNGISSWNPFDVSAFRRPGAEIREGLLPIWGAYASIGLPYDLSLEAFYQFEFQELTLDRAGTPFAGSDLLNIGSATGGNVGGKTWLTGGRSGGGFLNRNCSTPDALTGVFDTAYTNANLTQFVCGAGNTNAFLDYAVDLPIGQSEAFRLALNGGTADLGRLQDQRASDSGQYGVALRWYSEALNSTEFGFYFMNYHSRLPIYGQVLNLGLPTANAAVRTYLSSEDNASTTARGTMNAGCFATGGGLPGTPGAVTLLAGGAAGLAKLNYMNAHQVNDQYGLVAAAEGIGAVAATANGFKAAFAALPGGFAVNNGSALEMAMTNCALSILQSDGGLNIQVDGTELLVETVAVGGVEQISSFFEYPEDIMLMGVSFNTTVGDWGVQGEVAFRHDQPFQLDTDQITVAALGAACIFDGILGVDSMTGTVDGLQTYGSAQTCGSVAQGTSHTYSGVVRSEIVTFDIGTTATYTNSHPLIGALGADIGILLTEVGAMYAPDAPSEGDFSVQQWSNVCTSGTDLPLGSFVGLSDRSGCRPTQFSYGYVLVGILQYNNAFGTAITVSPRISWSHDVKGNSPAPMSNYREGSKQVSLAVDFSYQSAWRGGLSYTNIFGNEKYIKDGDKDFVSLNVSYSF